MKPKSNLLRKVQELTSFFAVVTIAALGVSACNNNSNTGSNSVVAQDTTTAIASPAIDTAKLNADWRNFKADANQKLKESDDSISALKKKVAKFDKKLKMKYDRDMARLERKNDTLKMRLNDFKLDSKEKWDDFKVKFDHDMDQVKTWLRDSIVVNR